MNKKMLIMTAIMLAATLVLLAFGHADYERQQKIRMEQIQSEGAPAGTTG